MTTRRKEFIDGKLKGLLRDWYQPKEDLNPVNVKVCLVIGKVLEEFVTMQSKNKLPSKKLSHLENNNPIQSASGFNPGHTMMTNELEHHRDHIAPNYVPVRTLTYTEIMACQKEVKTRPNVKPANKHQPLPVPSL
ncbi:hypothetical protein DSO57_1023303 [Entomophthora muscae]|uniref:Uncharacterized protein n=1 Tax=Entomophthora muscae TaxID=34485 RepID=A0ACC2U110_9FUNG|nr:hypothetical protein DSO57_1023303 [Entomophthora muscae]